MSGNHQNWSPKVGIGRVTPVTCDTITWSSANGAKMWKYTNREPWGSSACPKPRHKSSVSGFGPTPLPALCFASAQPHLVRTTVPCRHFIQCALNHATKAQFQVSGFRFQPNPPPCLAFCECTAPPAPQPPHTHHCTASLCHSPPLFLTACLKSSPSGSVSGS
jgi:hypothetical protein